MGIVGPALKLRRRLGRRGPATRPRRSQSSLEPALSRLATRQHGVVATWQLLELGFTLRQILLRVSQGRLHRVHRGVYAVGHAAVTREGRWIAAVLATGRDAVLSHRDAAALWEIADFTGPDVEVTLPELGGRVQTGIRVHRTRRLLAEERTVRNGIPVTSIERVLLDLASVIAPRHLRDAYVEADRPGFIDHDLLGRLLERGNGRKGITTLRSLVADLPASATRARSPFEVDFVEFCRDHDLPEPRVNVWVSGYLVDAHWPEANLVVELDSWQFHSHRHAFEKDRAEIGDLKLDGVDVIPLTYRRLAAEPDKVAEIIRNNLNPGG